MISFCFTHTRFKIILTVVEISGDGDDSVLDGGTEISFSSFLHLDEDHG
jgi:hypothetical protein